MHSRVYVLCYALQMIRLLKNPTSKLAGNINSSHLCGMPLGEIQIVTRGELKFVKPQILIHVFTV